MLKRFVVINILALLDPAAFRRLCVETTDFRQPFTCCKIQPPSGGCVLKPAHIRQGFIVVSQPPSGGCVLKQHDAEAHDIDDSSRLQAAVC